MTAEDALRWLEHEAQTCRDHDSHEAFCLLLPPLLKALKLKPMDHFQALDFTVEFKKLCSHALEKG